MGRKRYVTSDMSGDAKILGVATQDSRYALMWPWFCTAMDDWARMSANPVELKLSVFQAMPHITDKDIQSAMEAYERIGLAHIYTAGNNQYLQANPKAFYKLNTYIQKSRQVKDGSKFPPPPTHPWAQYWESREKPADN